MENSLCKPVVIRVVLDNWYTFCSYAMLGSTHWNLFLIEYYEQNAKSTGLSQ